MGLSSALVFVEIHRKLANYVIRNLEYHASAFPDFPIFLVSDDKPEKLSGQVTWIDSHSSIFSTAELTTFDSKLKNWTFGNQHSYWSATTKRLLILDALHKELDKDHVIHLESDSILLNEASPDQRLFAAGGIGYPLQNPKLGCASIFTVQNREALQTLINFILERWQVTDSTDMQLLGEFSNEFANLVSILPSQSFENVVYDPVIFGRYLLGSDARHFRIPTSNFGYAETEHQEFLSRIADVTASIKVNDFGGRALSIRIESTAGEQSFLANLHVHSKRIQNVEQLRFEVNSNWSKLKRNKLKLGLGAHLYRGRFDRLVFLERLLTKVHSLRGNRTEIRLR